jgi:DeoR/GlpR family transcriptional regulator of sugar metabolism
MAPQSTAKEGVSVKNGLDAAPSNRRHAMAAYVGEHGTVSLADLAARFQVSQMTVYRDVSQLEAQGVVRRSRGGVTAQPSTMFESNVQYRSGVHLRQKEAVCRAAVALVEPGMTVMLDDGTTLMPLAGLLSTYAPLTIISNFLPMVEQLKEVSGITLIALGGTYQPRHECFAGLLCADMIAQVRADLLFMSPSAVQDGFVLHQEPEMVATKRAMLRSSGQRVLLADRSKFGRRALHRVAPVSDFDQLIVDDGGTPEDDAMLAELDVEVTIVGRRSRAG